MYCACLLASHNLDNLDLDTEINPMFFVNVADIDTLTNEETFIACEYMNYIINGLIPVPV